MYKRLFASSVLLFAFVAVFSTDLSSNVKLYGFVRSDFYYNSRANEESIDGVFEYFPKPVSLKNNIDVNGIPNSEMISVCTRLGMDFTGKDVWGAKNTAKIECDFAGTGSTYFFIRLRQAFIKLQWKNSDVLVGQTWHPLYGSVMPIMVSQNNGSPFQPFNRSPQIRFNTEFVHGFTLTGAATYQMQYTSFGPNGGDNVASTSYLKNSILPNLFAGLEYKDKTTLIGLGTDFKRIKPIATGNYLHSISADIYGQYSKNKLTIKAKSIWGQNLSDQVMIGGYGVSGSNAFGNTYTNFNTLSIWGNVVYGNDLQLGVFGGVSQNLGTNKKLTGSSLTAYGRGFYSTTKELSDRIYRISPFISYKTGDIKMGMEYEMTNVTYGTLNQYGRTDQNYQVTNHRIIANIAYIF